MARSSKVQERIERDERISDDLRAAATEVQEKHGISRNRALAITQARDQLFFDQLDAAFKRVFAGKVTARAYVPKKKKAEPGRVLNTLWSDMHFHSLLDPREVPLQYGPTEEARRLGAICAQIAEYKRQYRDETELAINIAGDIIQGQLHDKRDGAPLAEQVAAAVHLLLQAILYLSTEFKAVTVRCTPGNHGRNTARHPDRATLQKWDSIETMIYFALKVATQSMKNVSVELGYRPYYIYEAFKQRAFITHGDNTLNPGYPGRTIDVAGVRKQINEFNAARGEDEKVTLFAVGHVHVGSITHLPNGTIFMSNGALIPADAYAQSIGAHDTACGQWLWESVPGHIVGDHRFMVVDEYTDKDKSLEKIIEPFSGF